MKTAVYDRIKTAWRAASFALLLAFALQFICGCNYARMHDDEAIQAYNKQLPRMPRQSVPFNGGIWVERDSNPNELKNPLAATPEVISVGAQRYGFYCVMCHGPRLDGNATVGQSFAPLPADLTAPRVKVQLDGELFYKIRFGYNRHPPLYSTATDDETWAIIRYIRSLEDRV